jgi:hypothetical protein
MRYCRYGSLAVLLSVFLGGASGCRSGVFLATAVMSQRTPWPSGRNGPDRWAFSGLDPRVPPRIRPGCYASATRSVHFVDAGNLGSHSYRFSWSEHNGIAYTCRGGHIDIAHTRKAADCAGYLAAVTLEHLQRREAQFQCKLMEPSLYHVTLTFPPDWDRFDEAERQRIARGVSLRVGQYLAYTSLTWHEIITWFGYRPRPHVSEFPSAFSWEDTYSNLLGALIAGAALEDESRAFNEAVTFTLEEKIEELGGQSAAVARQASESMRGKWYSNNWFSTSIRRRDLDVGWDDGYVTPCLVPSVPVCEDAKPCPLPIPTPDSLAEYGFSLKVEMEPKVWEMRKIRKVLEAAGYPHVERLDPAVHFPLIVSHIATCIAGRDDLTLQSP